MLGADKIVFHDWRVGGLVSYGHSTMNSSAVGSNAHSNDVTLGVYAGRHWNNVYFKVGAFYGWDMLSVRRNISVPYLRDHMTSSYLGGTAQTFGDLSYRFRFGSMTRAEPFANVAYVNAHTDGYHERGSGSSALTGRAMDTGVTYSTFGVRISSAMAIGRYTVAPTLSAGYRHAFGVLAPTVHERFMAGGDDFEAAGALLLRDAAVISAGASSHLADRLDVNLSYVGQYGGNYNESGVRGKFSYKF